MSRRVAPSGASLGALPSAPPPLVVMLSAAHPPDDVRVVRKEAAALVQAGWRVRHICPGRADTPAEVAGVAIRPYPRRRSWVGRGLGIPALARRAAASGAAVLHGSEPDAWLAALLGARVMGARVVLDVHEHYPSRLDPRLPSPLRPAARMLLQALLRVCGRAADAIIVAKDGLADDFAAPDRVIAVRNYAPALPVTPRRHGPGPMTLVHAGALSLARGWPQMLKALGTAPPGTRLRLIGRFTDGSEAAFRASAEVLGLTPRIECLPWMPQPDALARVAECDIGLVLFQPGERNHDLALPHKLFDCMLAGLPVIVPDFAQEVALVVREAGCGECVDTADPMAIAGAIARLADPGRRAARGAAGRAAALGRFGWAGEAERLVALYGRLAPLPPNPRPAGGGQAGGGV
jgi:glycosyltransferase involved in cell wall biosynthesis